MAIKKRPVSPRQKMINLMYVVLMAMLALNVSNEVLNGFSIVEESLKRTTINATKENQAIYDDFAEQMKKLLRSVTIPIWPPIASISRTICPLAMPPTAGLQLICAILFMSIVMSSVHEPKRAAALAASQPA